MSRNRARLLCLALAGFFLVVGWWPFAPFPRNQVSWATGRNGLSFAPPAVVYDPEPLPIPDGGLAGSSASGFALELSLETGIEPDDSFPQILTIHDGRTPSNLVIGQWHDQLDVQVPTPRNRSRFLEAGIAGLRKGQPHVVVISGDALATTFYMDGQPSHRVPGFVLGPDSLRGQLILGNAATGKRSWTGTLYGLAIFSRSLTTREVTAHQAIWARNMPLELAREPGLVALYDFADGGSQVKDHSPAQHHLAIPTRYVVLEKTVLGNPGVLPQSARATGDVVVNFLGFVPFGFLAFLSLRPSTHWSRAAILATLAGALVSLVIELGQVWLPTRDSSLLDLAYNTAGTGLGVLLALVRRFY